jgi:CxxC-x17-CxxC domain-containing protein
MHEVVCSSCGQKTTVPFKPTLDRPVYCRTCFQARRGASTRSS